jgi:hypothetical protein
MSEYNHPGSFADIVTTALEIAYIFQKPNLFYHHEDNVHIYLKRYEVDFLWIFIVVSDNG